MPSIDFQFSHVEQALAAMHQVGSLRRSAFQGRLKHYQRNEFPPGVNTGRGRAAVYHVEHALKLAIALEFNEMGLNPERAIGLVTGEGKQVRAALLEGVKSVLAEDQFPVFLYFDPAALSDLRDPTEPDEAAATLSVAPVGQLRRHFDDWAQSYFRRTALINVTELTSELAHRLAEAREVREPAVFEAMLESLRDEARW